jgi:hypothetical protein
MRLGEWRKTAPTSACMSTQVLAVLEPVLANLGAEGNPECWVAWGEDPDIKYSVFAPTRAGLVTVAMRPTAGDGPRATGKLVRWSKLQLGELSVESTGGHRVVGVQLEGNVLQGMDALADRICEFVRSLLASVDGRDVQAVVAALPHRASPGALPTAAAVEGPSAAPPIAEPTAVVKPAHKGSKEPKAALKAGAKKPGPSEPAPAPEAPALPALLPGSQPLGERLPEFPAFNMTEPQPQPPTPAQPARAVPVPPAEEEELDHSGWIGPHPIEDERAPRPRTWKP